MTPTLGWLLSNSVAAALLAIVVLLLSRPLRRWPALCHVLWLAVLLRLVLPPLPLSLTSAPPVAAPAAPVPALVSSQPPNPWERGTRWMTRRFGNNWSAGVEYGLLTFWALGAAALAARELWALRRVRSRIRTGRPVDPRERQAVERVASRLGMRAPRTLRLDGVLIPFVWSSPRPLLVLPGEPGARLSPTVLAHELAHVRRRDTLVSWLELAVSWLHWWNPVLWIARRGLRSSAELACDAWVVRAYPGRRDDYARSLLEAAEHGSRARPLAPSVGILGSNPARELEARLVRILHGEPAPLVGLRGLALAGALSALSLPGLLVPPTIDPWPSGSPWLSSQALLESLEVDGWEQLLERSEQRLDEVPTDGVARRQRGMALLGLGRYQEAAASFLREAELGHEPGKAHYNAACAWSLHGDADQALANLEQAAYLGFAIREAMLRDPDLEPLRTDPRFQDLAQFAP